MRHCATRHAVAQLVEALSYKAAVPQLVEALHYKARGGAVG